MKSIVVADLGYEWVRTVREWTAHLSEVLYWAENPEAWVRSFLGADPSKPKEGVAWPPYVFFVHWSKHVPKPMTDSLECVNFHCTPLPYGRGGHPIENMIKAGHMTTTMTAHRMVVALDAGPVYGKVRGISLNGSKSDILARFVEPVSLLMESIVLAEPRIKPVRQSGTVVNFARLSKANYDRFWQRREEVMLEAET